MLVLVLVRVLVLVPVPVPGKELVLVRVPVRLCFVCVCDCLNKSQLGLNLFQEENARTRDAIKKFGAADIDAIAAYVGTRNK